MRGPTTTCTACCTEPTSRCTRTSASGATAVDVPACPAADRILRPGGRLLFLTMSTLAHLCTPDREEQGIENRLVRPQFAPWAVSWEGYSGVEFHLSHGDWIALLRANGFVIDGLHELQAPPGAESHPYYLVIPADWARRWPGEDLWECRKT